MPLWPNIKVGIVEESFSTYILEALELKRTFRNMSRTRTLFMQWFLKKSYSKEESSKLKFILSVMLISDSFL